MVKILFNKILVGRFGFIKCVGPREAASRAGRLPDVLRFPCRGKQCTGSPVGACPGRETDLMLGRAVTSLSAPEYGPQAGGCRACCKSHRYDFGR
jgi:hypothetical protein